MKRVWGRPTCGFVVVAADMFASAGPARAQGVDPAFSPLPASGSSELQSARGGAVAASPPDGEMRIAGGFDGNSFPRSAELFNPDTDSLTALPGAR